MQLDFSTLLPILTAFIPILLPLFPGLNNLFKLLPNAFFDTIVRIKGGTITWPAPVASTRANYEARRNVLLAKSYSGKFTSEDQKALASIEAQLGALPKGAFLDTIMSLIGGGGGGSMLPILIIGGVAFMLMSGGCGGGGGGMSCTKKPAPATVQPKAGPVVIDSSNP